jgi:hypothetical protein
MCCNVPGNLFKHNYYVVRSQEESSSRVGFAVLSERLIHKYDSLAACKSKAYTRNRGFLQIGLIIAQICA